MNLYIIDQFKILEVPEGISRMGDIRGVGYRVFDGMDLAYSRAPNGKVVVLKSRHKPTSTTDGPGLTQYVEETCDIKLEADWDQVKHKYLGDLEEYCKERKIIYSGVNREG